MLGEVTVTPVRAFVVEVVGKKEVFLLTSIWDGFAKLENSINGEAMWVTGDEHTGIEQVFDKVVDGSTVPVQVLRCSSTLETLLFKQV